MQNAPLFSVLLRAVLCRAAHINVDHPDFRRALDSYQPPADGKSGNTGGSGGDFFSKFFGAAGEGEQAQMIGGRSVAQSEWKERDRQGVDMVK